MRAREVKCDTSLAMVSPDAQPRRTPPKKASSSSGEPTFRHPSNLTVAATEKDKVASKSENRRRSDSKPELGEGGEVGGLSVSVARGPLSENGNRQSKKDQPTASNLVPTGMMAVLRTYDLSTTVVQLYACYKVVTRSGIP